MFSDTVAVIPAFQAGGTVRAIVEELGRLRIPAVVVDDASTDGTGEEARLGGAEVLRRSTNGGKGAALRMGLAAARERGVPWIVTLDADGQHLPSEAPRLLEVARSGQADLVLGNRMDFPKGMPLLRRWTNQLMSWFISRWTKQPLSDTQCGFRVIARGLLESVPLRSNRFEIDSELVIRCAQAGFRMISVPVTSVYRRESSFIRPLRDTLRFFRLLFLLSLEKYA